MSFSRGRGVMCAPLARFVHAFDATTPTVREALVHDVAARNAEKVRRFGELYGVPFPPGTVIDEVHTQGDRKWTDVRRWYTGRMVLPASIRAYHDPGARA